MPRTLLYIVCHNDASAIKANIYATELDNEQPGLTCKVTQVSSTSPFFESQVFDHMDLGSHQEYEWVGVITYSFKDKLGHNCPNIQEQVSKASAAGADVTSLFNLDFSKPRVGRSVSMVESVAMQHGPYLYMTIYYMFKTQGFNADALLDEKSKDVVGFFSNWWLAKPAAMATYVAFYKRCLKLVDTHPLISKYIMEDSYYLGYAHKKTVTDESLLKTFGKDRYCLHPFVFERLPSLFFGLQGYKVYKGGVTSAWPLGD